MRGIAALVVAWSHIAEMVGLKVPPHADLAVDFFFVLSGFVLAHAYEERLRGSMTPFEFMRARLIRLHPLIVLGSAITLGGLAGRSIAHGSPAAGDLLWAAAAGIFLVPYHPLAWDAAFPLDGPAWSLFAEYAVNFLFAILAVALTARRLYGLLAAGLAMLGALLAIHGTVGDLWQMGTVGLSLLRVVFPFFAGVLVSRIYRSGSAELPKLPAWAPVLALIAILLAPSGRFDPLFELMAIVAAFPLLVMASARDSLGVTGTKAMLWGGALSYPLYILHFPIGSAVAPVALALVGGGQAIAVALTLAIVTGFSWVTLARFDEPVRGWLTARFSARRRVAA
jgi:peptidoglycan/LPS O-acetylase OafA/YrhL